MATLSLPAASGHFLGTVSVSCKSSSTVKLGATGLAAKQITPTIRISSTSSRRNSLSGNQQRRLTCRASFGPGSATGGILTPELKEAIDQFLSSNKVVLFMKGNKLFPQCGFSNTCVQILNVMEVPYETVNILEDEKLRQGMKEYSNWPTFPQIYIDGEFFGGCDIAIEAYQSGELKETLEKAMLS